MAKKITLENADETWGRVVPIIKVPLVGQPEIVGTGFFISETGIFVSARHVMKDVVNEGGPDSGALVVVDRAEQYLIARQVISSTWSVTSDIAISETAGIQLQPGVPLPTKPLHLNFNPPPISSLLTTYSFHKSDFEGLPKAKVPIHFEHHVFEADFSIQPGMRFRVEYKATIRTGQVSNYYPIKRDSAMLPFPCIESNLPTIGGNSGGPIFDERGNVVGINCTSFEGSDISYHTPISEILNLEVHNAIVPGSDIPQRLRIRDLHELGLI